MFQIGIIYTPWCFISPQTATQFSAVENEAIQLAHSIKAEYWSVSSLTGKLDKDGLNALRVYEHTK